MASSVNQGGEGTAAAASASVPTGPPFARSHILKMLKAPKGKAASSKFSTPSAEVVAMKDELVEKSVSATPRRLSKRKLAEASTKGAREDGPIDVESDGDGGEPKKAKGGPSHPSAAAASWLSGEGSHVPKEHLSSFRLPKDNEVLLDQPMTEFIDDDSVFLGKVCESNFFS